MLLLSIYLLTLICAGYLGYLIGLRVGNVEPSQPVNAQPNTLPTPGKMHPANTYPFEVLTLEPIQQRPALLHTRNGAKVPF